MIACICHNVTEKDMRDRTGNYHLAGTGCGKCGMNHYVTVHACIWFYGENHCRKCGAVHPSVLS